MISQCLKDDCWYRLASYLAQFQVKIIIYKEISHGVNQIVLVITFWSYHCLPDFLMLFSHVVVCLWWWWCSCCVPSIGIFSSDQAGSSPLTRRSHQLWQSCSSNKAEHSLNEETNISLLTRHISLVHLVWTGKADTSKFIWIVCSVIMFDINTDDDFQDFSSKSHPLSGGSPSSGRQGGDLLPKIKEWTAWDNLWSSVVAAVTSSIGKWWLLAIFSATTSSCEKLITGIIPAGTIAMNPWWPIGIDLTQMAENVPLMKAAIWKIRQSMLSHQGYVGRLVGILKGHWVWGRTSCLSLHHKMSGLVQTSEESVDTSNVLIQKPSTATSKHIPHCKVLVLILWISNTPPQVMRITSQTPLQIHPSLSLLLETFSDFATNPILSWESWLLTIPTPLIWICETGK